MRKKMDALIQEYDQGQLKESVPDFEIGDTVRVSTRIIEGEKERVQIFEGTVIARKGRGLSETFSLHRVSYGEGMERVFYLHSPRIVKIQVIKKGEIRRAKLYYLRGRTGKKAKVRERIGGLKKQLRVEAAESESQGVPIETEKFENASVPEAITDSEGIPETATAPSPE
jgi:large subunit ribosomal protein L19